MLTQTHSHSAFKFPSFVLGSISQHIYRGQDALHTHKDICDTDSTYIRKLEIRDEIYHVIILLRSGGGGANADGKNISQRFFISDSK